MNKQYNKKRKQNVSYLIFYLSFLTIGIFLFGWEVTSVNKKGGIKGMGRKRFEKIRQ